ncbi:hypothetical protein PITC_092310 [Penicillium italicum]|uniref:Allergen Asp f 4 n=1 Tax=Penicillium italicum TaxID=40296 RepID=A0A0A2LDJ9_PENIT|nr:hypothetical protein PITC_092310 [Penicillium italicum]
MLFTKSMLLMTALTAGSAVARLHGHDRRHAHPRDVNVAQPIVTAPALVDDIEKRGEEVSATIDGKLVSWINNWFGEETSDSSSEVAEAAEPTTAPTVPATPTTVSTTSAEATLSAGATTVAFSSSSSSSSFSSSSFSSSSSSSGSSGSSHWASYSSSSEYSSTGFGSSTSSKRVGSLDWDYIGNVGSPWGSNIIRVEEDAASQYKHVVRFENDNSKAWTVVMWNSYGPSGGLNGFWSPNQALSFTVEPRQSVFVAIDDDSQGGWGAAEGEGLPTNVVGEYASTWGEFDMSNSQNNGFSGWDVSCIIAELANMHIAGMQICNHEGEMCSSISQGAASVVNAYTSADQGKPDKAVAQSPGPVRLVVKLGWSS